jgi:hypothetical protein
MLTESEKFWLDSVVRFGPAAFDAAIIAVQTNAPNPFAIYDYDLLVPLSDSEHVDTLADSIKSMRAGAPIIVRTTTRVWWDDEAEPTFIEVKGQKYALYE